MDAEKFDRPYPPTGKLPQWALLTVVYTAVPVVLPPQCRVEGNPQNRMQFRVTVAAPDGMLAASVKDMVAGQVLSSA